MIIFHDGKPVKITAEPAVDIHTAVRCGHFTAWLDRLDCTKFQLHGVHFQSTDMFGKNVGFCKFRADVRDSKGGFVPGIVFARGDSVAMLPVFICEGNYFTALTTQPRVPTGRFDFLEIPAGTMDGKGSIVGKAIGELDEELGIKVGLEEMIDLSELFGNGGAYVSPGAADERLHYFAFIRHVSKEWLANVNGREAGLKEENEQITVKVVPMSSLMKLADSKSLVAHAYFQTLRRRKLWKAREASALHVA